MKQKPWLMLLPALLIGVPLHLAQAQGMPLPLAYGAKLFPAPRPVRPFVANEAEKAFKPAPQKKTKKKPRRGMASWYSRNDRGVRGFTANGERFDDTKRTCASWHYAMNTRVRITNLENGKSVVCRVNDRGPSKRLKRVIDMTRAAFDDIGNPKRGLMRVSIEAL
ncbi:MAG TPA: septal ring lytic transglycosylase RlpA family protein [Verrucomicrobiae bacterium]|jgi:rare lipoprotein A|nr:septal ring lytic transglycosylase RlpA family protein [Verrucomicrobiae bacterium]